MQGKWPANQPASSHSTLTLRKIKTEKRGLASKNRSEGISQFIEQVHMSA